MSARLPDWPARLNAFIERRRHMPFKWGVHDCCQFARAGAAAQRGVDPAAALELRKYRSSSGAAVLLRRLGGVEALPGACRLQEIGVKLAQRGDVVCTTDERGRAALGLCVGEYSAFPGNHGLSFVRTLQCRRAWRV